MTKRSRRRLFYSLIALFVLLGNAFILYSYGWRFDFKAFTIDKVGGLYVRSFPKDARIYLDDKLVDERPGIFDGGVFVNNLFPKNYKLSITADNYRDWQRTVTVEPSLVTEIKHAVLIPANPDQISETPARYFWVLDNNLMTQDEKGTLAVGAGKIPGQTVDGLTDDRGKILTSDREGITYFWTDIASATTTNVSSLIKKIATSTVITADSKLIVDSPENAGVIIYSPKSIYELDITAPEIAKIESRKNLSAPAVSPSLLAWTVFDKDKDYSSLVLYDKVARTKRIVDQVIAGSNLKLAFAKNGRLGILEDGGGFYIKEPGEDQIKRVASDVRDFEFSDDSSVVAALENKSVEIFALKSNSDFDYARLNIPDISNVSRLGWFSDHRHIFIYYPDRVAFLDILDNSLALTTVAKSATSYYDLKSNQFYFLKDKNVFRLSFAR